MSRGALHVLEQDLMVYRRVWRGSLLVSFLSPVLFLGAIGFGLGALVNRGSGGVGGLPYVAFLAPGLLATTAMQTGAIEATYPIMGKVRWDRTYEAMLATPLSLADLVAGDLGWLALRSLLVSAVFYVVMLVFGLPRGPLAPLAVLAGGLTGLAFAAPIYAFSTQQENDSGFASLQRFVIVPLFLFGGAFFPITRLPVLLQAVAWLTPLYHGVALSRGLALDRIGAGEAVLHAAVLLAYIAGGALLSWLGLRRRMAM
jgi:lipooligosaccharide transport system permease protein